MKLAKYFKDFSALTPIFEDFQGLLFYFEIQGLSRCVRRNPVISQVELNING